MKTAGIPVWITGVLGLTVLMGIGAGGMAMLGNGMQEFMGASWGGRNLGLGVAALLAILLKSPAAYIAVFCGAIGREIGDIIQLSRGDTPNWPVVILAVVLLAVWIYGILRANAARKASNAPGPT